jgi:hypothetical protein
MIKAMASTEQATKGQIGQLAACRMENKLKLRGKIGPVNYGADSHRP